MTLYDTLWSANKKKAFKMAIIHVVIKSDIETILEKGHIRPLPHLTPGPYCYCISVIISFITCSLILSSGALYTKKNTDWTCNSFKKKYSMDRNRNL